ncbi:hypothetical protein B4N89_42025 [Embleya scabrispora]|uniref:Uncharacterized protein n=1 Tax=Embleya scabrispora TaxID=159449 RepID=A0A1T3NKB1_9ACTN|nr:hypothetical protein [Embleya scabrispora]OPC77140.1 hypothetical protein B4N89_42025 [Embleya scabrispora]
MSAPGAHRTVPTLLTLAVALALTAATIDPSPGAVLPPPTQFPPPDAASTQGPPQTELRCVASALASSSAFGPEQIHALAACPAATNRPPLRSATARDRLTARRLIIVGLDCSRAALAGGTCHALSITLDDVTHLHGRPDGGCLHVDHVTARGAVRLRADSFTGRLFGVLPITLSTRAVPPIPLPHLVLTDVHADGIALSADEVHAGHTTFAGDERPECHDPRPEFGGTAAR